MKQQVAARNEEKSIAATPPDRLGIKSKGLIAKGTNLDERSIGVAPSAPKSTDPSEAKMQGAVGKGNSGGIGNGTPMPGLRASSGISGGREFYPQLIPNFLTPTICSRFRIKLQPIGPSQEAKVGLPFTSELKKMAVLISIDCRLKVPAEIVFLTKVRDLR